jgi:hypothetical protein
LKKWAKAPARTAQNRGDAVVKQQVAQNNHEAGLLHVVVSEFAPDLLPHRNKNVKGREETVSVSTVFRQFSLTKQIQHQFGNSFCMAIPSAIQFGNSVRQFSSAIRFGNSVRQFSSAIRFGNSVWQIGYSVWQFVLHGNSVRQIDLAK